MFGKLISRLADRHIVVYVLSKTYKSLEINSAGLYELQKKMGLSFVVMMHGLSKFSRSTLHCLSVQREAAAMVCVSVCV